MIQRYASLLSADASEYKKVIKKIENDNFDGLHFDIFDGRFVRSFAFSFIIIKSLRKLTSLPFNVHMEVEEPELFFDDCIDAGADIITFHPQASVKVERALRYLKAKKKQTSIALDLEIQVSDITKYLTLTDYIIVMSVYPGFGKQEFNINSYEKIKKLKRIIIENKLYTKIMIDGGANKENENDLIDSGVDILIYGSSIFNYKE
ncbi:MAG: ribulose-phosphate 3-epimerase [Candidatus Humimicrobiaceae bacterium]